MPFTAKTIKGTEADFTALNQALEKYVESR